MLICLFGHSYAVSILYKNELREGASNKINVYAIVGNWLETFFACIVSSLIVFFIFNPKFFNYGFWGAMGLSVFIYGSNCVFYRIKASYNKPQEFNHKTDYVLILPAILMVGVNIYLGSSILPLIHGVWWYYVPLAIFALYFLFIYLNKNKTIAIHIIFMLVVILLGTISLLVNSENINLPMKNMFLGIMVAIFLAIFEGWYVIFRQLHEAEKEKLSNLISWLIFLSSPIVYILYPIQDFNGIYIITFAAGILITEYLWFFKVYPFRNLDNKSEEFKKVMNNTAKLRATLGIITLIFLMLDKYFIFVIPKWVVRGDAVLSIGFIVDLIVLGIKSYKSRKKEKEKENEIISDVNIFMSYRLWAYMICLVILFFEQGYAADLKKVNASAWAIVISSIIELITMYFFNKKGTVKK